MSALDGMHPTFTHVPPMVPELTSATRTPSRAARIAAANPGLWHTRYNLAVARERNGERDLAIAELQRILRDSLQSLAESIDTSGPGAPIVIFNPLPWTRVGPVEIPWEEVTIVGPRGTSGVTTQRTAEGKLTFLALVAPDETPATSDPLACVRETGPGDDREPGATLRESA